MMVPVPVIDSVPVANRSAMLPLVGLPTFTVKPLTSVRLFAKRTVPPLVAMSTVPPSVIISVGVFEVVNVVPARTSALVSVPLDRLNVLLA